MPAESDGAAPAALAAVAVAVLLLPVVLLVVAPALLVRSVLRPRAPTYRRGGWYAIQ